MIQLDTSFLIDLLREHRKQNRGRATTWLEGARSETLAISTCVLCELRAGAEHARSAPEEHRSIDRIERVLEVVPIDAGAAMHYGRLHAQLRRERARIATMDLLIAASCLATEASLVTGNRKHFERIPGLELHDY